MASLKPIMQKFAVSIDGMMAILMPGTCSVKHCKGWQCAFYVSELHAYIDHRSRTLVVIKVCHMAFASAHGSEPRLYQRQKPTTSRHVSTQSKPRENSWDNIMAAQVTRRSVTMLGAGTQGRRLAYMVWISWTSSSSGARRHISNFRDSGPVKGTKYTSSIHSKNNWQMLYNMSVNLERIVAIMQKPVVSLWPMLRMISMRDFKTLGSWSRCA